jgi:ABC-type uncharacterized transport system permease subunit
MPPHTALSLSTALAYGLLAWGYRRLTPSAARWALLVVWVLHLLALLQGLFAETPWFGFGPALSVTVWLVLTVYAIESQLYPQLRLRWALAGLGAVAMLLAMAFPGQPYPGLHSPWLPLHWALGIASYGLIAAAVVHAWLLQRAERSMRLGQTTDDISMPLLTLERLTFRFVTSGFVLLTATLLAGGLFAGILNERWVWNHKTVFSVLAWLTMGVLLLGRWRLGWRGRTAVRTLYLGAGFLLLAYVGSRFVLEVILHRGA